MAIIENPTPGDDLILGDELDNFIDALAGNDIVKGNDGNDTLIGGTGNDNLAGGNGNDSVSGGTGNNLVNGGAGDDVLIVANGTNAAPGDLGDTLFGGAGKDTLSVEGASSYVLTNTTLNVGNILIHQLPVGSNKAEGAIERVNLSGNSFGNTIDASQALLEDQTVLFGAGGNDNIIGSQGLDQIFGGDGADSLVGGAGFNSLVGGVGFNTIGTNDGNDTLIGGNDGNSLEGDAGNDFVQGGAGKDYFRDGVKDKAGDDRYIGGDGDDFLFYNGGEKFIFDNTNFRLVSFATNPNNSLITGGKLIPGTANFDDSAMGTDTLEGIETVKIQGTAGLNRIDASNFNGDVILNGFDGNDILLGGRGNDILRGDEVLTGNDSLSGGLGNDTFDGGGFKDTDTLTGGNAFNGVSSADTFDILEGYRGTTGHAVISDFSVQDGDKLRLRFPFQGSPSDFTFVQQNFSTGTGTNSSAILDTVVFFGSPSAGDVITVLEDVNVNASTLGVEIF